jgi:hypothetical protein
MGCHFMFLLLGLWQLFPRPSYHFALTGRRQCVGRIHLLWIGKKQLSFILSAWAMGIRRAVNRDASIYPCISLGAPANLFYTFFELYLPSRTLEAFDHIVFTHKIQQ